MENILNSVIDKMPKRIHLDRDQVTWFENISVSAVGFYSSLLHVRQDTKSLLESLQVSKKKETAILFCSPLL